LAEEFHQVDREIVVKDQRSDPHERFGEEIQDEPDEPNGYSQWEERNETCEEILLHILMMASIELFGKEVVRQ
jgi:hypothetical protein